MFGLKKRNPNVFNFKIAVRARSSINLQID